MLRVFRHYLSAPALFLLLFESSLLFALLTLVLERFDSEMAAGAAPASLFAAAVLSSIGMYDKASLSDGRRAAGRLAVAFFVCWPALLLPSFFAEETAQPNQIAAAMASAAAMAGGLAGVFASRLAWGRVSGLARLRRRVLVLGVGPMAGRIETLVAKRAEGPLVVGYLRCRNEAACVPDRRIVPPDDTLLETAHRLDAEEIVVAVDDRRGAPVEPLLDCRVNGVTVTDTLSFWERETGQVMLDALSPSWLIYSDGFRLGSFVNQALKRGLDWAAALAVLVLTLPVTLVAAVAIKLDSPGPLFYRQERVGWKGRTFHVTKFRSMRTDAEKDGVPRWAAQSDPRVTRVGAFLRKTRIDEIPQVWNVLKGDMSFIGPRPERPFFVDEIIREVPLFSERARVRPGITGWAQVNYPYGASIEDAKQKLAYDLYYIKNYSLLLDVLVLVATVEVVLWPKGVR